ncbi:MAG: AMIN domain-containing protein [Desulfobulbaceae bacterium]|nr:AMIN domain-containing protein [Desulfobulbaceae bacterium]
MIVRYAKYNLLALLIVFASFPLASAGADTDSIYKIQEIDVQAVNNTLEIRIKGNAEPIYNPFELQNPYRIVIDITNSILEPSFRYNSQEGIPIDYVAKPMEADGSPGMHFEFELESPVKYNTYADGSDIVILMEMPDDSISDPAGSELVVQSDQIPAINASDIPNKEGASTATALTEIQIKPSLSQTEFIIIANGDFPKYSYNALEKSEAGPARLYFDFDNVGCSELLKEQEVDSSVSRVRVSKRDGGTRIVFDSSGEGLFDYDIKDLGDRISLIVTEGTDLDGIGQTINRKVNDNILEKQLPDTDLEKFSLDKPSGNEALVASADVKNAAIKKMEDSFGFAGYNKERITVDFYKIDIHNVFRLLRTISKKNLIIDQAVSGTLTLNLKDVPWDFALDLILNIKGLSKEERFNTIVILPKKKKFTWPESVEDNLSFEADPELAGKDSIVIQKQLNLPPEVIEAKKLISLAADFAKKDEYEDAIEQYKKAFILWPDNSELANLISSLYLVHLRQNANATFYAKKALEIEPDSSKAALNAGISLANMLRFDEAKIYFDQSVSGVKPSKEALLSYAVFAEQRELYDAALKLLEKHNTLYGNNLDSMLAEARLLDKQGKYDEATGKYTTILLAGFHLPMDLRKYINSRVAAK